MPSGGRPVTWRRPHRGHITAYITVYITTYITIYISIYQYISAAYISIYISSIYHFSSISESTVCCREAATEAYSTGS